MNQVTFTFRVDEPMKEQLSAAAKGRDRTAAQLLRDFMREYVRRQDAVEHDAWFRAQVDLALQEADAPDAVWVSEEDAAQQWANKRAALLQRPQGTGT